MLKIRMQRTGRVNDPSFRIIVAEHTESPKTGNFVERIGTYNPRSKQQVIDAERVKYWMSVGAKPSDTVHNMLVTLGIIDAKKINVLPKRRPVAETPAEEVKAEEAKEAPALAEEPAGDAPTGEDASSGEPAETEKAAS